MPAVGFLLRHTLALPSTTAAAADQAAASAAPALAGRPMGMITLRCKVRWLGAELCQERSWSSSTGCNDAKHSLVSVFATSIFRIC